MDSGAGLSRRQQTCWAGYDPPMPTWAKFTVGFVGAVLGYAAWGAFVLHAMARADAIQRADPDPTPDAAGIPTALEYVVPTACLVACILIAGGVMCFSSRLRTYGLGVLSGVALPILVVVSSCAIGMAAANV